MRPQNLTAQIVILKLAGYKITARAQSQASYGPRVDQQAGYICATSENMPEINCEQQPVHTFGPFFHCRNSVSLGREHRHI